MQVEVGRATAAAPLGSLISVRGLVDAFVAFVVKANLEDRPARLAFHLEDRRGFGEAPPPPLAGGRPPLGLLLRGLLQQREHRVAGVALPDRRADRGVAGA